MKYFKRWIPFILLLFSLFMVSACGDSLQKPTGLENDNEDSVVVLNDSDKADFEEESEKETTKKEIAEKEDNQDNDDKTEKKKSENSSQTKKSDGQTSKQTKESKKKTTKSGSNKESKTAKKNKPKSSETSKKSNKSSKKGNESSKPKKDVVTISIVISSSEVPLGPTEIEIESGDKVLDVFYRATNQNGIQQSVRGAGGSAYIEGIANVYEFDRGQGSGWMYRINGIFPDRGVGAVPVEAGDRIELLYTVNLGKDLNANLQPFRR